MKENLKEKRESLNKPITTISKSNETASNNAVVKLEDEFDQLHSIWLSKGEWAFEVFWTESHITQDPDVV